MGTDEGSRLDFVKEMYRVYWANMARSMESVWKILAPITVVGTILAGVHKDYLPTPLGISLAFVIIFWALNVTIDLNAWHRRNLFFTSKVEQEFLSPSDYGDLLPEGYRNPKKDWITFYTINAATFLVFLLVCILYAAVWKLPETGFTCGWLLPLVVLAAGFPLTWINFQEQEKSAHCHHKELFKNGDSGKLTLENQKDADAN